MGISSCVVDKNYDKSTSTRGSQKAGYHKSQAEKVVVQNEKNRDSNIRAGDKKQAMIQGNLEYLNAKQNKTRRDAKSNTGMFGFY